MRCASLLIILITFASCATPYQRLGEDGGYLQQQLDDNMYRITFRGNSYTERKRAQDFALLRAAEIGRTLDYTHFAVLGEEDLSQTHIVDMGTTAYTSGSIYGDRHFRNYYGTTRVYNQSAAVTTPGVVIVAKYFKGPPTDKYLELYEVDRVLNEMCQIYDMPLLREMP